jgi:hypothetical protein
MSDYRAFYVGKNGQFTGSMKLDCDSDSMAIASAKKLLNGQDIEVWDGLRKISQLKRKLK